MIDPEKDLISFGITREVIYEGLENIMTHDQINEAVARKLGYIPSGKAWVKNGLGYGTLPDYCHSIEAAWEILANLVPPGGIVRLEGPYFDGWECGYVDIGGAYICLSRADTASMAIALAFLKLKE